MRAPVASLELFNVNVLTDCSNVQRLEKAAKTCARELHDELQDAILDRYEAAVQAAAGDSVQIAAKWGSPINRENRMWSSCRFYILLLRNPIHRFLD